MHPFIPHALPTTACAMRLTLSPRRRRPAITITSVPHRPLFLRFLASSLLLFTLLGCEDPDPRMVTQSRVLPYEPTPVFPNNSSARDLVPGTVPLDAPPTTFTERRQNFSQVQALPVPLTADLLKRGQERYNIYCTPCHGATGYGDGMIVQRGMVPPPSFHIERLRTVPIGHFVDVITNGWGAMFSYAQRVSLDDRWAIAAYIRALQLSQHAPANTLSPEEQQRARQKTP